MLCYFQKQQKIVSGDEMNYIKELRTKLHLSQIELAKKVNVSQQAIAKWESGISMPRSDKLPLLASALKCSINDLFVIPGNDSDRYKSV